MTPSTEPPATPGPNPAGLPLKPRWRGVMHQYSFFVSVVLGAALVIVAPDGEARLAAGIYAFSVSGLLGTSALYHRITWRPRARAWMRRLDHSMIFVLIAGTYTPFALLVLDGTLATVVLIVVWAGAAVGITSTMAWPGAPKWVTAATCVAVGWVAIAAMPEIARRAGVIALLGLALGGALYTAGAIVYARERPNPRPAVFGYHEVFHALVIAAAAIQYLVVAFFVLPAG